MGNIEIFRSAADGARFKLGEMSADGVLEGCREGESYLLRCPAEFNGEIYVDDVRLRLVDNNDGLWYVWSPELYAGEIEVAVESAGGERGDFRIDVSPHPDKLGRDVFREMLEEIRRARPALLLGDSPARVEFGHDQTLANAWVLLRFERLRRYGPMFLKALERVAKSPHEVPAPMRALIPIHAARHVLPSSLAEPRLVATLLMARKGAAQLNDGESLRLVALVREQTVDTPANRAIKALLCRFRAAVGACLTALDVKNSDAESGPQFRERWPRRQAVLKKLHSGAEFFLKSSPLNTVGRAEVTAAGLTQVSASPNYSLAYRRGKDALGLGISGLETTEDQWIRPSWGVYEAWCLIHVVEALLPHVVGGFTEGTKGPLSAELAMSGTCCGSGNPIWVFYQPMFPAERASLGRLGFSLSRERYPDVVVARQRQEGWRYVVFDAKYRQSRQSTLEAMESAHIYHDSLRLDNRCPDYALLMLPGSGNTPWLIHSSFWQLHGVGAISELGKGGRGTKLLDVFLRNWIEAA